MTQTFRLSRETRRLAIDRPFSLESGEVLPRLEIAYRTWGKLAPAGDNTIVVCHALTGSADADAWWPSFFGAGSVLDPAHDFIVCSNALGSCYGSSGPISQAPDGRPWGGRFPALTIRDQVRAQIALADELGIRRIRLVLGGSLGGLQALEWALLDAERVERVERVASIAASGRHSAWCAVWSEAQRMALATDPKYRGGDYPADDPPRAGLAAARAVAMISYRSPQSLERFDANSYRRLLDAMDSHDLGRGRGDYASALRGIAQPVLIGSLASDALYVPQEQRELARLIPNARLVEIDSAHGHDGFLLDAPAFHPQLLAFKHATSARRARPPTPRREPSRWLAAAIQPY